MKTKSCECWIECRPSFDCYRGQTCRVNPAWTPLFPPRKISDWEILGVAFFIIVLVIGGILLGLNLSGAFQ